MADVHVDHNHGGDDVPDDVFNEGPPASVYAMMYSVGPILGASGITDTKGYKQIYIDAMHAISTWNRQHPAAAIKHFRVPMISTNAFAGTSDKATLRLQAAGLIVEAVLEAMQADASLESLIILINTNDTADPSERDASTPPQKPKALNLLARVLICR